MSIAHLNGLDKAGVAYKEAKLKLEKSEAYIHKKIENEAHQEKLNIEKAISEYNAKIKQILNSDDIRSREKEITKHNEVMKKSIKIAFETYTKVREIIYSKENLSDNDKREYEKKLYEKIMDKFMSEEEKELFKQLMKHGNVIIMSGMNSPINGTPLMLN